MFISGNGGKTIQLLFFIKNKSIIYNFSIWILQLGEKKSYTSVPYTIHKTKI